MRIPPKKSSSTKDLALLKRRDAEHWSLRPQMWLQILHQVWCPTNVNDKSQTSMMQLFHQGHMASETSKFRCSHTTYSHQHTVNQTKNEMWSMWHVRNLTFEKFERIQHSDWGVMSRCKQTSTWKSDFRMFQTPSRSFTYTNLTENVWAWNIIELQCHRLGR